MAVLPVVLAAVLLAGGAGVEIVAVAPNPVADGDAGEYVVLSFPAGTNLSGWAITDGESTVRLPGRTVSGRIVVTTDPDAVAPWTELPVLALTGHLALSNDGERIRLIYRGTTVDAVRYSRAPDGERYVRTDDGWRWRPAGATDLPIVSAGAARARVFVLPDAPHVPIEALGSARERVLLGGYSFTSARATRALCTARDRGVRVHVLVDDDPVGGMTRREARRLDALDACGVTVDVLGGPRARYAFHHAKYAVIDDGALVMTENWKPSGTGGRSSRGWGVLVRSPLIASALAATFGADAGWRDAVEWRQFRRDREFVPADPVPRGRYPSRFPPRSGEVDRVDVLVAPDNAEAATVGLLDSATGSIRIQQVAIGGRDQPFLRATLRAARRGVDVRVLVSGAWYVREENAALVAWLNGLARREGIPLEARLARPRSRFGKTHVKGVIVDGDRVAVGSMNWNNHSARRNREVVLVLHGEFAGEYYSRVFRADWRGGMWQLPVGIPVAVAVVALGSVLFVRSTVRFTDTREESGRIPAWDDRRE